VKSEALCVSGGWAYAGQRKSFLTFDSKDPYEALSFFFGLSRNSRQWFGVISVQVGFANGVI
jgi:hypothetical protein